MKAVVLESPKKIIFDKDYPDPVPYLGEVVVDVKVVSICGSDIRRVVHVEAHTYPMILGHEIAGVVSEVGEQVYGEWLGKRVSVVPLIPCMDCPMCLQGRYSGCQYYSFIGSRRNGGFAEKVAVPRSNLIEIPDDLAFEHAALIEPSSVALHALERGGIAEDMSVAVLGSGSIGMFVIQWAKIKSASLVIASDVDSGKLQLAKKLGADITVDAGKEDIERIVREQTGEGVDLTLETAGTIDTLTDAVRVTRPGGVVVCVGNLPSDTTIPASLFESISRKELGVRGSWMSYSAPFPGHEWHESVRKLADGSLDPESMISHRFQLEKAPAVFKQIESGKLNYHKIILCGK